MVGLRSALLSAGSGWSSTANLRLTCWLFAPGHVLSRFFRLIRPLPFEVAPVLIFHSDPAHSRVFYVQVSRTFAADLFLAGVELWNAPTAPGNQLLFGCVMYRVKFEA